ncbi:MAG: hypothetical protein NT133_05285 [Alphaproteobacteria bacterium]|nr:hypothetical protein [Alphaproteobacteria bacterium]
MFASPKWLLLGVPALLFPILLVVALDEDAPRSAVDIAVSALPIAGDAAGSDPSSAGKPASAFGDQSRMVPVNTASSLYSRSAQVAAVHSGVRDTTAQKEPEVTDYNVTVFNALHPRDLAAEDLLSVGATLRQTPFGADFARIVYREFCTGGLNSQGAPGEFGKLGISNNLVGSLLNYMPLAEIARACPQLR